MSDFFKYKQMPPTVFTSTVSVSYGIILHNLREIISFFPRILK